MKDHLRTRLEQVEIANEKKNRMLIKIINNQNSPEYLRAAIKEAEKLMSYSPFM